MPVSPYEGSICLSDGPVKGDIAIKKDHIYYIKSDGLYKMRTDGSDVQLLQSGDMGDRMTIAGGWVYFHINNDGLYRTPMNGGEVKMLQKGDIGGRVAVSGSWVFYSEPSTGLCRMWEDGSYVRVLVGDPPAVLINVTEGHIYFTKDHAKILYRSWEDGDNEEEFPIFGKDVIHIADGCVYSKDHDGFYRMRIDRTKMNRVDMDVSNESFHNIRHIDTADGWIFYDVGNDLFRIRADGSDAEKLNDGIIEGVRKVVDDWIYYVKDGKLFRKPIS